MGCWFSRTPKESAQSPPTDSYEPPRDTAADLRHPSPVRKMDVLTSNKPTQHASHISPTYGTTTVATERPHTLQDKARKVVTAPLTTAAEAAVAESTPSTATTTAPAISSHDIAVEAKEDLVESQSRFILAIYPGGRRTQLSVVRTNGETFETLPLPKELCGDNLDSHLHPKGFGASITLNRNLESVMPFSESSVSLIPYRFAKPIS